MGPGVEKDSALLYLEHRDYKSIPLCPEPPLNREQNGMRVSQAGMLGKTDSGAEQ